LHAGMVHKRILYLTLVAAALYRIGIAQSVTASAATANSPKIAARALYPNPSMTRGRADTLNATELNRARTWTFFCSRIGQIAWLWPQAQPRELLARPAHGAADRALGHGRKTIV
jgi:hypothetical protein